jgi:hypothetical protein
MNIEYVVGDSDCGKCLYARQQVKAGAVIWDFKEGINVTLVSAQESITGEYRKGMM